MLYQVTYTAPGWPVHRETRKRLDAARLLAARQVYAAADAQALRDRPVAHRATADAWNFGGKGCLSHIRIGSHLVTIEDATPVRDHGHPW